MGVCLRVLRRAKPPPFAQEAALCYNSPSLSPGPIRSKCWDYKSGYSVIPFLFGCLNIILPYFGSFGKSEKPPRAVHARGFSAP